MKSEVSLHEYPCDNVFLRLLKNMNDDVKRMKRPLYFMTAMLFCSEKLPICRAWVHCMNVVLTSGTKQSFVLHTLRPFVPTPGDKMNKRNEV